ncbi:3'-5' exonuclease [Lysobacter pythonis]|uniref:3'-5' exonuclease n=1 Tax=Solilutibacter pythonis TaxID=2483112 RepID=A0A3M2HJ16_9GAMM|nr:exonuclease domain-containing protein [Lysobacter pythonis]RMH87913.1 3'-5' exonuclease [Lysobacter pythonis]
MSAPGPLQRWWTRRRHGEGEWGALFAPPPREEWVSLDLETTGMDTASDHILSLAAVPVRDGRAMLSERFTRRIRPDRGFDIESIRHHHITPEEAAAGLPVTRAVREFLHWLGPRALLGYYLAFDLRMLAPHVRAITGFALPNARHDLADEVLAAQRRCRPDAPPNLDFRFIADTLGVPVLGRHSALGDALTVAACWLALRAKGWQPPVG